MALRTFKYTGKTDRAFIEYPGGNAELQKGKEFTTDDPRIAAALLEHPEVKEVVETKADEDRKPSRRANGPV